MDIVGILLLIAAGLTVVLELVGVARVKQGKKDTLTEFYRDFRDRLSQPWRFILETSVTLGLVWAIFHFRDFL